jgi:hypothetical protein
VRETNQAHGTPQLAWLGSALGKDSIMVEHLEVAMIGVGPGGEQVPGRRAEAGLDGVGIEKQLLEGECPIRDACLPR